MRFARWQEAEKEFQQHRAFGISVRDGIEQLADNDIHTEFFAKFAGETLLKGFSCLAFASGKFPQPAEMRIRMALCDEEFAGAEDEAGADFNDSRRVAHRPMLL